MGIKQQLKQILPPTGRAFSARIDQIEQAVASNSSRLQSLQTSLADAHWAINETKAKADFDKHSDRYTNPEICALPPRNPGQKRILLAGWYGAENLGDELMMQTVVEHIPEEQKSNTWVMLWDNFAYPVMELDPLVNVIHYPRSLWELRSYADAFDILIWGGGAIIDDKQYSNDPLNINTGNLFIHLSKLMESRGKQVVGLGLSTSAALVSPRFCKELSSVIKRCEVLAIRDHHSMESLAACNAPRDNLTVCNDLVFANSTLRSVREGQKTSEGVCAPPKKPFTLAFVALCTDYMQEHYIHVLSLIQKELGQHPSLEVSEADHGDGYRVVLVPFGNLHGEDSCYYQQLLKRMEAAGGSIDNIEIAPYASNVSDLALCQCDFYIAYKYHAALIANAIGMPGISVCATRHPHYPNKMAHLAQMSGYASNLVEDNLFEQDAGSILSSKIKDGRKPHLSDALFDETSSWLSTTIQQAIAR